MWCQGDGIQCGFGAKHGFVKEGFDPDQAWEEAFELGFGKRVAVKVLFRLGVPFVGCGISESIQLLRQLQVVLDMLPSDNHVVFKASKAIIVKQFVFDDKSMLSCQGQRIGNQFDIRLVSFVGWIRQRCRIVPHGLSDQMFTGHCVMRNDYDVHLIAHVEHRIDAIFHDWNHQPLHSIVAFFRAATARVVF